MLSKRDAVNQTECQLLRQACNRRLDEIQADLRLVKGSLVGIDANGGLVAKVNVLNERVSSLIDEQKNLNGKREADLREGAKQRGEDRAERKSEQDQTDSDKRLSKTLHEERIIRYQIALIGVAGAIIGIVLNHFLNL